MQGGRCCDHDDRAVSSSDAGPWVNETTVHESVTAWAASGAMGLTGRADAPPLGPPALLGARLRRVAWLLERRSAQLGHRVALDPLALLGERAAIAGLHRNGTRSCGGATRLLRARDGWMAVTLARPDDVELVPAWLELELSPRGDPWPVIERVLRERAAAEILERGLLVGLPLAVLPARPPRPSPPAPLANLPLTAQRVGDHPPTPELVDVVVIDMSGLWAGPLCGSLLALAGAEVIKLESTRRPDGARRGPGRFFDLLNAGKQSVALDFTSRPGRQALHGMIERADVVIEGSRPRAVEQLGVDAEASVRRDRPRIWVAITGHGRTGSGRDRVAFGDDAAVAGGLVVWDGSEPCFCADAVADPVAGLVAATACLDALAVGGRWILDVALAGVAADLSGPTVPTAPDLEVAPPWARHVSEPGPTLGAHTRRVLERWGLAA